MDNKEISRKVSPAVIVFSIAVLIAGVGCIGWALTNIVAQTRYIDSLPPDAIATGTDDYNASDSSVGTDTSKTVDTVTTSRKEESHSTRPSKGRRIGSLYIPVLGRSLAIIEGTGAEELKRGVGHYRDSVMPGEKDNCILSGHRDTFLSGLGKVGIGDELIVKTSSGRFTYIVKHIRIVKKNDKTVIVSTNRPVLTLTTCYPFHYIGPAPKRYIVSADLASTP